MATNQETITLKFVLNGVETSVKNIGELEAHLKQMKKDLKGVEIGSEQFKQMQAEIKQADASLKELNAGAKNSSGAFTNLTNSVKNNGTALNKIPEMTAQAVAAYAAVAAAMSGIIQYGKESIEMFLAQEDANDMVSDTFGSYAYAINEAANETQKFTKIGNEQYQSLAVQAKNFGVATSETNKYVQNAIALADLYGAAGATEEGMLEALIDAQNGKTKGLETYVKELRGVTDEEERARILQEKIAKGWEQASTAGATYGDQLAMMKNAYGDLQEELGKQILTGIFAPEEGKMAVDSINGIIDAVEESQFISKYIGKLRDQFETMFEPIQKIFKLFDSGADSGDILTTVMDALFKIMDVGMLTFKTFWGTIEAGVDYLLGLKDIINSIIDGSFEWQKVWNVLNQVIVDLYSPLAELFGLGDELNNFFGIVEDGAESMEELATGLKGVTAAGDKFLDTIDKRKKKVEEEEDAAKDAASAYESYAAAIFKANEEYKLSIALGDDELESLYNLQKALYEAEKAYASIGGYTEAELKKLEKSKSAYEETAKKIDGIGNAFDNIPQKIDTFGVIYNKTMDDIQKKNDEVIKTAIPRDTITKSIELAEDVGSKFRVALKKGFETEGDLRDKATTFISEYFTISKEKAKQYVDGAASMAQQIQAAISTIREQNRMQEMSELESRYQRQLELAGDDAEKREQIEKSFAIKRERLEREQNRKRQREAIANTLIAGAVAFTESLPNYILAGLTAVSTAAQIAIIKAQKFALGGILKGPSHANGGILTQYGELEGGEMVVNKRSTAMYPELLSAINTAGGGVPITQKTPDLIDYNKLALALQAQKVYVVSGEITNQQSRDVKITNRAKI